MATKKEWKEKGLNYDELVKESAGVYYSCPDIFLMLEVEYGIDDRMVLARVNELNREDISYHVAKIQPTEEDSFVKVQGTRIPMSEVTRFGRL